MLCLPKVMETKQMPDISPSQELQALTTQMGATPLQRAEMTHTQHVSA